MENETKQEILHYMFNLMRDNDKMSERCQDKWHKKSDEFCERSFDGEHYTHNSKEAVLIRRATFMNSCFKCKKKIKLGKCNIDKLQYEKAMWYTGLDYIR
jgi:hypothetical protein